MDVIELAQRLIRTPSPVWDGNEVEVAEIVQSALSDAGLPSATVVALEPDRPNLHVTIDFGPGGRSLVLAGHLDTKPIGDAKWTVDPFAADISDGKLYGLGSADMKGAIAAMIVAAERLTRSADVTAGRLTLVFTADEEAGANFGARFLADEMSLSADALVIGEPGGIVDDYDSLHLVSRGLGRFSVAAHAHQGHSSLSAMLGMRNAGVDLAGAITELSGGVQLAVPPDSDGLRDWAATVNPALRYSGGVGYGVLPEVMGTSVEVRTLPGMQDQSILDTLRAQLTTWSASSGADVTVDFDDPPRHWITGTQVRAADPIVAAVHVATQSALGRTLPLSVFPGTTDTSWFAAKASGMPCLPALGPGLLRYAHGADEWVSVAAVRDTVDLYEVLAREFCTSMQGPSVQGPSLKGLST